MKKLIISILGLGILGLANANEKIGDLKSSATMQATCSISANQISFGMVATPLMSQSANSEMSVKCSNASAYTIDLAYGGIYGEGSGSGYTLQYFQNSVEYNRYHVYNNLGNNIGELACGYADNRFIGKVYFQNATIANLYGYTTSGWQTDTKGTACISNNTQSGTRPVGWVGNWNAAGEQAIGGTAGYSYGVMNGMSKGDKLAYSIAVPGEPTKVWNAGNNNYKSTGNGDNQSIPLNAKIVPDKSTSKYLAPDMYLDTVTAVISY